MEYDLIHLVKWKTTSTFSQMEHDLNFLTKLETTLIV